MSNNKRQNEEFIENFEPTEGEIYNALIELGWLLPRNEEEMIRAEKALEGVECPALPAELENPAPLIERLRKEESAQKALATEKLENSLGLSVINQSDIETQTKDFWFDGILAKAKTLGIGNFQLAEMTKLSVVLIAQFDRSLIKVNEKLPIEVVKRIADSINETSEQLFEYWRGGPRFAKNANYKADESPILPEAQDFTDAVGDDPTLSEERREELLALSQKA